MRPSSLASSLLTFTLLLAASPMQLGAAIINVPEDHRLIQAAIDASEEGDTVLVQPGVYNENINFNGHAITVASLTLTTGNPAYIDSTIIDGRRQQSTVTIRNITEWTTLRGFTIRNGRTDESGGGVIAYGVNVLLEDLAIRDNLSSGYGSGIAYYADVDHNRTEIIIRRVVVEDNQSQDGAGIALEFNYSQATLEDVIVRRNRGGHIGGMVVHGALNMRNVAIVDNEAPHFAGMEILSLESDEVMIWENVTFAGNGVRAGEGGGGPSGNLQSPLIIRNSVFFGNEDDAVNISTSNEGHLSISHCLINGGREAVSRRADFDWLEGNLDEDPRFVDPENGNYRLQPDSPCIDAGDPESPDDPDDSRADMGAFRYNKFGFIGGLALDAQTGEPIPSAHFADYDVLVDDRQTLFLFDSDEEGRWGGWFDLVFEDPIHFDFEVVAPQHSRSFFEADLEPHDSLWIEVRLERASLRPSTDSLFVEIDSGGVGQVVFSIGNDGEGALRWSAFAGPPGEPGSPPFTLRDSLQVSLITDDDRIEGVAFDGENYFLSGANGADTNLVYIISREGVLIDSFPQVHSSRYGYKDLEWDGEYLWGVGEDSIFALTAEGATAIRIADPLNPSQYIAIDRESGVLWLSGTTTNVIAVDRLGNNLGRTVSRMGFRIYGLGWLDNDPDDAGLYVVHRPSGVASKIHKFDVLTGDTTFVTELPVDSAGNGYQSIFISRDYDKYQGSVLMTIQNRPANIGGDRLDVFQLNLNKEWILVAPDEGEIEPGENSNLLVELSAAGANGDWTFDPGEYEGEILFVSDAAEGDVIVPLMLRVLRPNVVNSGEGLTPSILSLSAFPNPFNSMTTLTFSAGEQGLAPPRLAIYDLSGRLVSDLRISTATRQRAAVDQKAVWDASGLPGGIYFVRLEAGTQSKTIKTILMK